MFLTAEPVIPTLLKYAAIVENFEEMLWDLVLAGFVKWLEQRQRRTKDLKALETWERLK
jgi:hypothetical protein